MQDYISDKAIWEGSIPSEGENTQVNPQPQMMFCYKCQNVIPGDSKYCPCCKVELFTTCPNCGKIYSSQYHICNKCGTDRNEYLRLQKIEREIQEKIERENQRQRERLELTKREREQQEKEFHKHCEARRREQREAYARKKEQIIKTKEYKSTYSILRESLASWRQKHIIIIVLSIIIFAIIAIWFSMLDNDSFSAILAFLAAFGLSSSLVLTTIRMLNVEKREQYIWQYIKKKGDNYNKGMLLYVVKRFGDPFYKFTTDVLEELPNWCIEAYRKTKRMD